MSEIQRYAIVRGHTLTEARVKAYLPSNYRVLAALPDRSTGIVETVVVIAGRDDRGWTLHQYVAPRLGSGLMACEEIDLSHPIMEHIPADA